MSECYKVDVPRYKGPTKNSKPKLETWCVTHNTWNCKDGIIKI